MNKIIHLSDHVVSQIAAGEVIERPAYAVKELVENSIDADPKVIEIHIEEGGLQQIQVIDTGQGMSRDDLLLSILPHTTSKLLDESFTTVKTLGFRGEALAAIAAVSTLSIKSRTADAPGGYEIIVRNGVIEESNPVGMPIGTIVTVDNLYKHIPARKKFLKSAQTEFRHITGMVTSAALTHPEIHFILTHNKKVIFDLGARMNQSDRVKYFLGTDLYDNLLPLESNENYFHFQGFIGRPQVASKQNAKQFFFINNRPVTDALIALAAKEAFGTLLPVTHTPVVVLFLSIPTELVDVNVHPRKEQVAIHDHKLFFDELKIAIQSVLAENNLTFRLAPFTAKNSVKVGETTSYAAQLIRRTISDESGSLISSSETVSFQFADTYIVTKSDHGIVIVDQHAAHERILFEELSGVVQSQKKSGNSHMLSDPLTIDLSLSDSQTLDEHLAEFLKLGFGIEHFQGTSYIVRKIPSIFFGRRIVPIIQDMLTDLSQESGIRSVDLRTNRMLAFLACRAAVKSGDALSDEQMKSLIEKLDSAPNNTTCPHGRPTRYALSKTELDVLFKRK